MVSKQLCCGLRYYSSRTTAGPSSNDDEVVRVSGCDNLSAEVRCASLSRSATTGAARFMMEVTVGQRRATCTVGGVALGR